ncbi:hypothetical protein Tsubulata_002505 [Turnera subulata]|uniref:RRM domain-containing protein n=1 Tax=Turnera subulata TaxID=218843 RepID=A0A9Q0J991_9ROSI|nr:hypothetical protein Tsubulata_002505 [Turnera subulata]
MSKYGDVVDVYIPSKRSESGKRFGFVRYRGVRDSLRLLADVNRVYGEAGTVRASVARQRTKGAYPVPTRDLQPSPRILDNEGTKRGTFVNVVQGKSDGGKMGTQLRKSKKPEDGSSQGVSFIPSTDVKS